MKPDNIILSKYGETFVVDWGLAVLVDAPLDQPFDESLLRARLSGSGQSGSVVGTPGYMSPEQTSGEARLTSATDVYGLGATLYFVLTGRSRLREKPDIPALRTLGMLSLQSGAGRESLSALTSSMDSELDGKIATKRGWLLTAGLWPIVLDDFDRAIAWHHTRGEEDWEAYAGRAFARAKLSQHAAAIDDIEKAIRLGLQQIDNEPPPINHQHQKGILLFNAACTYAVVVRHLRLNQQAEPDHEKNIQDLTQRAIDLLRLAQDRLEPKVLATALSDDALDSVRETKEFQSFQKLLAEAIGQ